MHVYHARPQPKRSIDERPFSSISGGWLSRRRPYFLRLIGVRPFASTAQPGVEEQDRQLQEEQLGVDERVDGALPPPGFALAVGTEPRVVGRPVARFVLPDDVEDLDETGVGPDEGVAQQDLDLAIATLLGQRNYPAKLFE